MYMPKIKDKSALIISILIPIAIGALSALFSNNMSSLFVFIRIPTFFFIFNSGTNIRSLFNLFHGKQKIYLHLQCLERLYKEYFRSAFFLLKSPIF